MAREATSVSRGIEGSNGIAGTIVFLGRLFFTLMFIMSGPNHFSKQMIGYAAAQGVPLASLAVPISGVLAFLGGLSILLGYRAKIGAWLIVLFLVPVTLTMHKFWGVADPMMAQNQMIHFWKNIVMAGASLMIYYFVTLHPEPWPYSLGR